MSKEPNIEISNADQVKDQILAQVEYQRKKAESLLVGIVNITVGFLIACSLLVIPDISAAWSTHYSAHCASSAATQVETETQNTDVACGEVGKLVNFIGAINIKDDRLKLLLSSLPLVFGAIVLGLFISYRHHNVVSLELLRLLVTLENKNKSPVPLAQPGETKLLLSLSNSTARRLLSK